MLVQVSITQIQSILAPEMFVMWNFLICVDLTDRVGFWAKAVNEKYAEKDAVLYFYVTKSGVVHYGINERSKEVFFTGVDTSNKLWAMIDVYGNSKIIELVNHKLNNMTPDQEAGFDLCHLKR